MFVPTLRENPAEAELISHQLMLKAGLIRKLASGVYCLLPLGYKVIRKIEQIIREEMDNISAQELLMPALLPSEIYKLSGRWELFGEEMFRLKDRHHRDFCLGATHEEVFTEIVKNEIKSYRSLPHILYQFQAKYRDERRPRFGIMRSREFLMKDAYSFDRDEKSLDISYKKIYQAYCNIFSRLNLDYTIVDADTGEMGGASSQEFMVKSDVGESLLAICESCSFAANQEKAPCITESVHHKNSHQLPSKLVNTPNARTIEELSDFFKCPTNNFAKTLIYKADGQYIAALVRGDRELNEVKLQNYIKAAHLELASPEEISQLTGAEVGFTCPVNLDVSKIIADLEIKDMTNFIVGANKTGYHIINSNIHRDFEPSYVGDIRKIENGDKCPICGHTITLSKGVEVGHIFKLGTKYSQALNCLYLDESGNETPIVMGSYGIGVGRTMAAIIEQNSDQYGIIWPFSVAPYQVVIIPVNPLMEPTQMKYAQEIYNYLKEEHIEVILDDRYERAGVKFKDADLIGIPIRITVGKKIKEGIVEFKLRKDEHYREFGIRDAVAEVLKLIYDRK